jgi:hypothetical protein
MAVGIVTMLKRSDGMLVDRKRDGNDDKPDGRRWVDVRKDGDAQDGKLRPLERIGCGKRDSRRSYFNRATPTSSLENTVQATRLWSTSQMILFGDIAVRYALQSVSLRPHSATLQPITFYAAAPRERREYPHTCLRTRQTHHLAANIT